VLFFVFGDEVDGELAVLFAEVVEEREWVGVSVLLENGVFEADALLF
jgi:hypothetical protein